MANPFSELYKNYSTAELLEIVQLPSNYKPTAIEAAREILQSRNISEQDTMLAVKRIEETKAELPYIQKQFKRYNDYFFKSVDAIHQLGWRNIIPLLIVIANIFAIKASILELNHAFHENNIVYIIANILGLLALPLIIYLFYSKSKWFWIILFGDNIFGIYNQFKNLFVSMFQTIVGSGDLSTMIHSLTDLGLLYSYFLIVLIILLKSASVYYFSLQEIKNYYAITALIKNKVLLVVIIFILIASIISLYSMYVYYNSMQSNIYFQF
ncbi:MAG: hypothetical protein WCP57_06990 [Bacteroidota bacterium]